MQLVCDLQMTVVSTLQKLKACFYQVSGCFAYPYTKPLDELDDSRQTKTWIRDRASRVEAFVRIWIRDGMKASYLASGAPDNVGVAEWLTMTMSSSVVTRAVATPPPPSSLEPMCREVEMLGNVRAAVLEYASPSIRRRINSEFDVVARHSAAYMRNIRSIMHAGQQLADAYERIREVRDRNATHVDALTSLCSAHYPDITRISEMIQHDQHQAAKTTIREIMSKMRSSGYMDADEVGKQLLSRYDVSSATALAAE